MQPQKFHIKDSFQGDFFLEKFTHFRDMSAEALTPMDEPLTAVDISDTFHYYSKLFFCV